MKPVIIADISGLLQFIIDRRDLNPDRIQVQLGLDGGQGILKVCMLIYEQIDNCHSVEADRKRLKYSDGVSGRQAKLTSVKKLMVVAAAPGVQETWQNIKSILEQLQIFSINSCVISFDMKVQLILCGKQTAASKHPCPYCECMAPFSCVCPRNTLGSLQIHHEIYIVNGRKKANAKLFNNCVNLPLLQGPHDLPVIEMLTFPELHVMTGTVGHLINNMMKGFPEGEKIIADFMKDHNITWCVHQPGTFEGNQARKLLQYSPKLLQLAEQLPEPARARAEGFIEVIAAFSEVVKACFGQELKPDYAIHIQTFESAFRRLSISITPKSHLVFEQLAEILETKGSLTGLGRWSEQAMASVHHDMKIEGKTIPSLRKSSVNLSLSTIQSMFE